MASDAKACFSSKVEYHAVIRYLYLKGKTDKEIHGELANVYGFSAQSYAQVKFCVEDSNAVERLCWQGDSHSILGCKRRYYVGLFTQEKYNNWSVLCKLVRPAENRHP